MCAYESDGRKGQRLLIRSAALMNVARYGWHETERQGERHMEMGGEENGEILGKERKELVLSPRRPDWMLFSHKQLLTVVVLHATGLIHVLLTGGNWGPSLLSLHAEN